MIENKQPAPQTSHGLNTRVAPPYIMRTMDDFGKFYPAGRGLMPGAKLQHLEDGWGLLGARGLIPGTGHLQNIERFGLVVDKKYPDYDVYQGKANKATLQFHSLRMPFLDSTISWLSTKVIEFQTKLKGGKMLDLKIWVNEDRWSFFNTYRWSIVWTFYTPGAASLSEAPLAHPAVLIIGAILAVLGLFILFLITKQVKEIIHGYPDGDGKPGLVPSLTSLALIGGGLALAFVILSPKIKTKKRKKK